MVFNIHMARLCSYYLFGIRYPRRLKYRDSQDTFITIGYRNWKAAMESDKGLKNTINQSII